MVVEPNVGLEIIKGVGKVVVQELHGILELVFWWAVIMLATIYIVGPLGGNGCHWDWLGWHGGAQGGKGGHQGVYEYKVNISLSIVRGLISNWPQVCKIHINFLFKKVLHRQCPLRLWQMTGPVQLNIDFSSIESILPLDWYSGAIWIHKMEFLFKIFIKQDPLVTKGQFRFSSIWVRHWRESKKVNSRVEREI